MTFSEIVDAADLLSLDEQQALIGILRQRIAERNRQQLLSDVGEARSEFIHGRARTASAKDIMDEVHGEP